MKRMVRGFFGVIAAAALTACAVPLAPGADQVRITRNAADVAVCTPVGNIDRIDPRSDADAQMRNQAVGLGGNVVLDTTPLFYGSPTGVVYRCGSR